MENLTLIAYVIYATYVAALTVFVAKMIFRNSLTFMMVIFNNKENLATATNKLFEVGFFLFGFGIGLWFLTTYTHITNGRILFETLSMKIGSFTIFMGILLFGNLYLFFRGMKARKTNSEVKTTEIGVS
jgi:hypothetical protein